MRAAILLLLLPGCASPAQRYLHAEACGPAALARTLGTTPAVSSQEILDDSPWGDAAREALGVFDLRAACITWPEEIEANVRRHDLRTIPVGGGERGLWAWARTSQRGVLLLREKADPWSWHYTAMPCDVGKWVGWTAIRGWEVLGE